MATEADTTLIDAADFSRRFGRRGANLMWLLGAGASAAAGVPTAGDMVWEFKQLLYVSQRHVSTQAVADLSNPAIRERLQAHVDSSGRLPAADHPEEYAALFEAVYPAEADRRSYLDSKISGAKPSYGHVALATLMRAGLAQLIWTPNFDSLVADACAKVFDTTGALTTATLDGPDLARQAIAENRWPIEVKLHGDFRSRRLKNTGDELRQQDARFRQALIGCCGRFGLVVVGYSGRDDSVMDALEEVLAHEGVFPSGLFWLHRGERAPLPRVERLLDRARTGGVEAALVQIENFDEALRDIVRLSGDIDTVALNGFATERKRWSGAPVPRGRRGWPVVRLNGLPVVHMPTVCRRIVCEIGGYADVREAVEKAAVDLITARVRPGILAFGSDAAARDAFDGYGISEFDLHTLDMKRMRHDTGERGLVRAALARALARSRGLAHIRRRSSDLLYPSHPDSDAWAELRRLVGALTGTVSQSPELHWNEGIGVRLDWADDRLWLVVEPRTVFQGITDANVAAATDFGRERTVRRYNRQLNDLIACWAELLAGSGDELRALGISDGVDAVFRLASDTAFSWRAQV